MRAIVLSLFSLTCCQTYDFEPVQPVGLAQTVKEVTVGVQPLKPNVLLVVDKSGSMSQPLPGGGTRMTAMQAATSGFIGQAGGSVHLGVLPFPADGQCGPGHLAVELDQGDEDATRLQAYAVQVSAAIEALDAGGGTPTAATITSLEDYAPLQARDRANFAVLLTDGLPNCNPNGDARTCTCTESYPTCPNASFCLDDTGTAAELARLKSKGVRTIVVGFGTDVMDPLGAATLASMATAGGFTRPCSSDADCNPGDTCRAGGVDACGRPASTCTESFFQATDGTELSRALERIQKSLECEQCWQRLNASPSDSSLVSVLLDGEPIAAGPDTWQFHPSTTAPAVEFLGSTCAKLNASSAAHPLRLEIRTVERL